VSAAREVFRSPLIALRDGDARGFEWDDGGNGRCGFLVRRGEQVFAYHDRCPHTGGRLEWKPDAFLTKDRSLIMCSVHGANFRIHDGHCVAGPCFGRALEPLIVERQGDEVVVRVVAPAA
jgi:nitrite reductase/ring-hydroxylating ferredoxin subunit